MRRTVLSVAVLALALAVGGCGIDRRPRADETDRIATVVSDAISFPRQPSATEYARAAGSTRAGQDGRLTVVGILEAPHDDVLGHLVFRVHLEAYDDAAFFSRPVPEVATCYDVEVGRYGVQRPPQPRSCPPGARPVVLPPPPLVRQIPDGADAVVAAALRRTAPGSDALATSVRRGLPAPGPRALAPEVRAAAQGADMGVSVRGEEGECLLGSRADGRVLVWYLEREQAMPGEVSCDPASALGRLGVRSPH